MRRNVCFTERLQLRNFSKAGVIITRGRRSLGYGFVEFVKPEDAAKSVEIMNKREYLGRPLKVELAKDPSERPDRFERTDEDKETHTQPSKPEQETQTQETPAQGGTTKEPQPTQDQPGAVVQGQKKKRRPKRKPKQQSQQQNSQGQSWTQQTETPSN